MIHDKSNHLTPSMIYDTILILITASKDHWTGIGTHTIAGRYGTVSYQQLIFYFLLF